MSNMVWGRITACMDLGSLSPLVEDLKTALGAEGQVEVKAPEISGKDIYSVGFILKTSGDISESSVMDAVRAISQSRGCVYFMDTRSMSVNNSPTITLYDLSRSIYPVVETDYGVYVDVHSFLEFGETIVTDF